MNQFSLPIKLDMKITISEDTAEALEEAVRQKMSESDAYKPVIIEATAPESAHVEYGTRGHGYHASSEGSGRDSRKGSKRQTNAFITRLEGWVSRKFHISDPKELHNVVGAIYRKIVDEGTPPQPFFRPVIYELKDAFETGDYSMLALDKEDITMTDIAEAVVAKMKERVYKNDSIDLGTLVDGIRYRSIDNVDNVPVDAKPFDFSEEIPTGRGDNV